MPLVAFATCDGSVFKRNFVEAKWKNVDPSGKPCRIQFLKKGDAFFMRLVVGGKPSDFAVSRDNKMHYSADGFIQIPLSDVKELYGIKFKDPVDGEQFYAKIVNEMNLGWSAPKTTIGPDNLPHPAVNFGPTPTKHPSLPNPLPPAAPYQDNPRLRQGGMQNQFNNQPQTMAPNARIAMPPSMMNQQQPVVQSSAQQSMMARNNFSPTQAPPSQEPQYQPPSNQFGNQREFVSYAPRPDNHPGQYNSGPPGNQQRPNQGGGGGQGYRGNNFNQPPPNPQFPGLPQGQYNTGRRPDDGYNQQSHQRFYAPQKEPARPPKVNRPPQRAPQPQRHRDPEPVTPEQLPNIAQSLMNAVNKGDTSRAEQLLKMAITAKANIQIKFEEVEKPKPKQEFMLDVVVEFQQPQKKSLNIFLDHIHESDTVFGLQVQVEQQFYIPRSSQNWIIGSKLIKGEEELQKALSEHGLKYVQGVSEAKVYLYVMHTKKANVAKEDNEAIQSRRKDQLNRQQQSMQSGQQPPLPQTTQGQYPNQYQQPNFPQGGRGPPQGQSAGDPNQSSYPQGYPRDQGQDYRGDFPQRQGYQGNMMGSPVQPGPQQTMQGMGADDPTYAQLSNRGFNPGFTESGIPNFRAQQDPPPPQVHPYSNEPVYQRLDAQVRPNPDVRNPPMSRERMLLQQNPGGQNVISRGQEFQQDVSQTPSQKMLGIPLQLLNPAAPQAPPEPPEEPEGWECPKCTFFNKPRRPGCELCSGPRPDDYVVPEDVPLGTLQIDAQKNDQLFQEFEKEEEERKRLEALQNYQALVDAEDAEVVTNKKEFDCLICYTPTEPGEGVILRECVHEFCKGCLHHTITNANTAVVTCPFDDGNYQCQEAISEREMRTVLTDEELEAVHRRGLREAENASGNSFHCKTADCGGFCFYEDDVNIFQCPVCTKRNCILCKAIHEGMDCKEYQDDLKRRAANDEAAQATQNMLEELVKNGDAMRCPKCDIIVQKKDGCDWIRCLMCRTEICWATKGPRWGPNGHGDISGGCRCRVNGKKCNPLCRNCH